MVRAWASREIFFQSDKVGEPITPLETQLRIKLMMHDRSQLSGLQGRILEGYRLISFYRECRRETLTMHTPNNHTFGGVVVITPDK